MWQSRLSSRFVITALLVILCATIGLEQDSNSSAHAQTGSDYTTNQLDLLQASYNNSNSLTSGKFQETYPDNFSQSSNDVQNLTFIGQLGGHIFDVDVRGHYAFVAESQKLAVLDVSDPSAPRVIGKTAPVSSVIPDVEVVGNYAYVVSIYEGLHIVDISHPTRPTIVGTYDTEGVALRVAVAGDYAYVADQANGLRIIDITNPSAPVEVGSYVTSEYVLNVTIAGNYGYIVDGYNEEATLRIIDIANPTAPTEVGFYRTPGEAINISLVGDYAYVADGNAGLRIINIADPTTPTETGYFYESVPTHGAAYDVAIAGNYAYVATHYHGYYDGLNTIDISNPAAPRKVGFQKIIEPRAVAIGGNYAYVASSYSQNNGLSIINIADPTTPIETGYYDAMNSTQAVAVAGKYAYVADGPDGLRVVNIANPATPNEVGRYDTPGQGENVAVVGNYAYIADGYGGMRVINVDNPAAPAEVNFIEGDVKGVAVAGNYAYLVGDGLRVIDIINPAAPIEVGYYSVEGGGWDVAVDGNYAYVASWTKGLRIIDVSNPASPSEVGFYAEPDYNPANFLDVAVTGDFAYVAAGNYGFYIFDISDPADPKNVSKYYGVRNPNGVAVAGDYAYVANMQSGGGLHVLDISDPTAPTEVGIYIQLQAVGNVTISGNHVFATTGNGGLMIARRADATPDYSVSGRIINRKGWPIKGVKVTSTTGQGAVTDTNGSYAITGLAEGAHRLTASRAGYVFSPASRSVTVPPDAAGCDFYAQAVSLSVDPAKSNVTANPLFVEADGWRASQVTITLKNAAGEPVPGKMVQLLSDRGPTDTITQPTALTDSGGQATATVQSLSEGQATLWAWVTADGIKLEKSATITFGPTEPVPDAIQSRADVVVGMANRHLDQMWVNSQAVVDEAVYFRGAIGEQAFELTSDLAGGVIDTFSGLASWRAGELATKYTFPGWSRVLNSSAWASPFACKISNGFIKDLTGEVESEIPRRMASISLRGGLYLLTAQKNNTCLGDLAKDTLTDSWHILNLLDAHLTQPNPSVWPIKGTINDSRARLQSEQDRIHTMQIPNLTQGAIDAYLHDLGSRGSALPVFSNRLQDARWTLEAVHQANAADPVGGHGAQIAMRLGAQYGAEWVLDGAGRALVKGTLTVFDTYMNTNALLESSRMALLANSTILKIAPETVQQVTDTIGGGLEQIVLGQEPITPQGNIQNVEHFSGGSYLDPLALFWREKESYSLITVKNTGDAAADFHVVARYLAQSTRLTVPWAALWLDKSSDPIRLKPNETWIFRVNYKDDSKGYSPTEGGYGLSASDIKIDLLAVNEAGFFHLDHDASLWNPSRATSSVSGMLILDKASSSTAITIDEPIVTTVESGLGRSYQTGYVWVNNPFDDSVSVTVTQPLFPEMTLLDPGGGTEDGGNIVWSGNVDPLDTIMFTFTFTTDRGPGADLTLPAAELAIGNPSGGAITVAADPPAFTLPWPITISQEVPEWIPPTVATKVTITATNQTHNVVSGSFTLDLETVRGNAIQTATQQITLRAKQSQLLTFDLPTTLNVGDYQLVGTLQTQGEQTVAFTDPFNVGARSPYLATTVSPVAPDGTVKPGATLTYKVLVENAETIPLTDVSISNTIPADVNLISVSHDGKRTNGAILWVNQEIPPETSRTYTFIIRIPESYVAEGEGRYIHSVPTLLSEESPKTTGLAATVLVISVQERKVYLPVALNASKRP